MDPRHQLAVLRGWLPLVIGCALVAGAAAFLISGGLPKAYEAKSKLVVGQSLSAVNPDYTQLLASQQLSATYVELATTRPHLQNVIDELHLKGTPEDLKRRVSATVGTDSTLLTIGATDPDPTVAAAIANALALELIKASPDLQGQEADVRAFVSQELQATQAQIESTQGQIATLEALPTRTPGQEAQLNVLQSRLTTLRASYAELLSFASNDASNLVTIVEPAVAPVDPVSPRPLLNTLLASVLAVLLALAVVVLVTYFDDSLKDPDQVRDAVGLATLGTIPRRPSQRARGAMYQLVMLLYPRSASAEAYRTLRSNLEFASVDAPIHTLLVTSPGGGDGKTVTAANLAVAFAQAGRKVLLVDADLRKPGVDAMFNVANDRGLSTLLRNDDTLWESVVQTTEQQNLRILTTGPQPSFPAELLGTKRMREILETLQATHDIVVIDSAPLLVVADPAILSSYVDGTLLVFDVKKTGRAAARQGRDALAKGGGRILGVLLNGQTAKGPAEYGDYYQASGVPPDPTRLVEPTQSRRSTP